MTATTVGTMKKGALAIALLTGAFRPAGRTASLAVPTYAPTGGPEIRLDRIVYPEGSTISAAVRVVGGTLPPESQRVVFIAPDSRDGEVVKLQPTGDPNVYITERPLPILRAGQQTAQAHDGQLTLRPNESFLAVFTPNPRDQKPTIVADFGLLEDRQLSSAQVQVVPQLDLSGEGKDGIGTINVAGGLPMQLPVDELVLYPRDSVQLKQFLQRTRGRIAANDLVPNKGQSRAFLIKVTTDSADVEHLPQMRALLGAKRTLYASSPEVLRVIALALQYQLDGFAVTLNPRFRSMGPPSIRDGSDGAPWPVGSPGTAGDRLDAMSADPRRSPAVDRDTIFGVREAWAYLALFDRDTARVPVAFIDNGFAPNPDFRGYNGLNPSTIRQCNMESGSCAPGAAVGRPTIGPGYFGSPWLWHGNGVVGSAGGVLNNGWGAAGTGGQVVVPSLYSLGPLTYFQMANAIVLATDSGADVINLSAGLLCGVPTDVGIIGICDNVGRTILCNYLHLRMLAAAQLILASAPWWVWLDPTGTAQAVVVTAYATAMAGAEVAFLACTAWNFMFDAVGYANRIEYAASYASSRGVTIVAAAGNGWGLSRELTSIINLAGGVNAADSVADHWRIVPCIYSSVICVGGVVPTPPYPNGQWYGDSVDIWAPQGSTYYAPGRVDVNPGPANPQVPYSDNQLGTLDATNPPHYQGFWGTSGATAFTTGVVAMMIAANSNLDRRSSRNPAAIPGQIRNMLVTSATPALALSTLRDANPNDARRNLINAYRAVLAAAWPARRLPDLSATGDTILGFDEVIVRGSSVAAGPATPAGAAQALYEAALRDYQAALAAWQRNRPTPERCRALPQEIAQIESHLAELREAFQSREPAPSSAQRGDLGRRINELNTQLEQRRAELARCNEPRPQPPQPPQAGERQLSIPQRGVNDRRDDAVSLSPGTSVRGTILTILGAAPDSVDFTDEDWYAVSGPYSGGFATLEYFRGFERLLINDSEGEPTTTLVLPGAAAWATSGWLEARRFAVPRLGAGEKYYLRVWGGTSHRDNIYWLYLSPSAGS